MAVAIDYTYVNTGLTTVATVAAAGAAFLSWKATRAANRTADSVAQIERDRWHMEMTPKVSISAHKLRHSSGRRITVQLNGPAALDSLDAVEAIVCDSIDSSQMRSVLTAARSAAGRATERPEDHKTLWSNVGIETKSGISRSASFGVLRIGEMIWFKVAETEPPSYATEEEWRELLGGQDDPVVLLLRCSKDGFRPWHITATVALAPGIAA